MRPARKPSEVEVLLAALHASVEKARLERQDANDEPCVCGTGWTCMADSHDRQARDA